MNDGNPDAIINKHISHEGDAIRCLKPLGGYSPKSISSNFLHPNQEMLNALEKTKVEWEDGLRASFNYLWLQDNSASRPSLVHLDLNARPESVNFSSKALNLIWPPFSAADYSSRFLRENALVQRQLQAEANGPSTSYTPPPPRALDLGSPTRLTDFYKTTMNRMSNAPIIHVATRQRVIDDAYETLRAGEIMAGTSANGEEIWALVDAVEPNAPHTMSRTYWGGAAREPGTLWSHLPRVPDMCSAEPVACHRLDTAPPIVSVVDAVRALSVLAARNPQAYDYLCNHYMNYSDGVFAARHAACHRSSDGHSIPGVFNNGTRSTRLIAEPVEPLYASLQQLGRICGEMTRFIRIPYGKRLIIDNQRAMMGVPSQAGRRILVSCIS